MSNYKKAILALILANIIWGGAPPLMKWALRDVPTFTLAFLRFAIPTVLIFFIARNKLKVKIKDIPTIFLAALFGITFNIGLYFIGVHYTTSINVTIIASASPVFLVLGSILFLQERPLRKMLLGNLLGLTGVFLIVVEPILTRGPSISLFGNILLVGSAIAAIINTLLAKKLIKKYKALTLTFWTFAIGALTFFPLAVSEQLATGFFLNHLTISGIVGIVYGSIFASFFAWLLFYWGLKYVLASETGVFMYIDPVATLLVAIPLLGEYPSPFFIVGSVLVFGGIYISEGRLHWHPIHRLFNKS